MPIILLDCFQKDDDVVFVQKYQMPILEMEHEKHGPLKSGGAFRSRNDFLVNGNE